MSKTPPRGSEPAEQPPSDSATQRLPAERAFVVQLRAGEFCGAPLCGRVEHVLSGRCTRFQSLEHLAQFFVDVIAADLRGEESRSTATEDD